jgi:hypothetical protein
MCRPVIIVEGWHLPSPRDEARAVFEMVQRNGSSIEEARELISISEEERREMAEWAQTQPAVAPRFESAIRFRSEVLTAFDQLSKK